jgi:hypothetical protein
MEKDFMASNKETAKPKLSAGDTVGLLTIIGEMKRQGKKIFYPCRCACGNEMDIAAISLWNGNTRSCGCDKAGVNMSQDDSLKIPAHLQCLFDLISQGRLPPADGLSAQGNDPTWNLRSIAKIIGVSEAQLISHFSSSAPRFADELALS